MAAAKPGTSFVTLFAVLLWMGGYHATLGITVTAVIYFPSHLSLFLIALLLFLAFSPLALDSFLARAVAKFVATNAVKYFPIQVEIEDESSLDPSRPYVLSLEPHSVLPVASIGMNHLSGLRFPLRCFMLASSAVFATPIVRHVFAWLDCRDASHKEFCRLLEKGCSVSITPGGVQEVLRLEQDKEVLYLRRRVGFIKLAVKYNAPVIPVFLFGQRNTFNFRIAKGGWFSSISRYIGFAPVMFWGRWFGPIPVQTPITIFIGKPIEIPGTGEAASPEEAAEKVHTQLLKAYEEIYAKHADRLGHAGIPLEIM